MNGNRGLHSFGIAVVLVMLAGCAGDSSGVGPVGITRLATARINGQVERVTQQDGEDVVVVVSTSAKDLAPARGPAVPMTDGRVTLHSPDVHLSVGDTYLLYVGWRQAGAKDPLVLFALDADGNPLADFNGRADNGADVNGILECVGSTAHLPTHEAVLDALATEGPNQPDGTLSRALYACGTQASPH